MVPMPPSHAYVEPRTWLGGEVLGKYRSPDRIESGDGGDPSAGARLVARLMLPRQGSLAGSLTAGIQVLAGSAKPRAQGSGSWLSGKEGMASARSSRCLIENWRFGAPMSAKTIIIPAIYLTAWTSPTAFRRFGLPLQFPRADGQADAESAPDSLQIGVNPVILQNRSGTPPFGVILITSGPRG